MHIPVSCEECGGQFKAPPTVAGRRVKCPKCGAAIAIPAGGESMVDDWAATELAAPATRAAAANESSPPNRAAPSPVIPSSSTDPLPDVRATGFFHDMRIGLRQMIDNVPMEPEGGSSVSSSTSPVTPMTDLAACHDCGDPISRQSIMCLKCGRVASDVDQRLYISCEPSALGGMLVVMGFIGLLFFLVAFDVTGKDGRIVNMDLMQIRLIGVITSLALMIFGRIPSVVKINMGSSRSSQ